mgnify:CR=1 FL=1
MNNFSLSVAGLILTAFSAAISAQQPSMVNVKLVHADFAPIEGVSYDPVWPGPPRRAWLESDKKFFVLTAKLSHPAPEDFKFAFLIRENKTWDFDPEMSYVVVEFKKGDITAKGNFWLVCNREGRIQGTLGREFDGYGNLYAKPNAMVTDMTMDGWSLSESLTRNQHPVRCSLNK